MNLRKDQTNQKYFLICLVLSNDSISEIIVLNFPPQSSRVQPQILRCLIPTHQNFINSFYFNSLNFIVSSQVAFSIVKARLASFLL